MATSVALTVEQGTNFGRVLTIRDDDGTAIDITGYTFRGQARTKYGIATISFSFTFVLRTQSGGDLGKVDMTLVPSDTASLSLSSSTSYVYDVEMVTLGGVTSRLFEGLITVTPEATK